ncbi:heparan sulfate glucosamine 3-O-sulfotransferase 5-like [Symsagittifera roscoffensis]|uniref:heparan sulfate glucosamine 3-O-sulfotransferase 5-like n=1 Tax=Symsagittifera roscoffensis TaxID=84072 RepID=UPI00307C2D0D
MVRRNTQLAILAFILFVWAYIFLFSKGSENNLDTNERETFDRFGTPRDNQNELDEEGQPHDYQNELDEEGEDEDEDDEEDYSFQYPADKKRKKRYPTVLIIGSQKSGTTSLRQFLKFHPDIVGPERELHYFDKTANGRNYEKYLKKMPKSYSNQITIEKTPNYFTVQKSPGLVLEYQKFLVVELKLILIVRDPIRRSISHAFHSKAHGRTELKNLTTEILAEKSKYIYSSLFGQHFERWLKYFRRDQFLVLDGEKFAKENPTSALKEVENFLGIKHAFKEEDFGFNDDKGFYCYNPTKFCFPSNRGHAAYPQQLTPAAKTILKGIFEKDLETFWRLAGVNYNWTLGADV